MFNEYKITQTEPDDGQLFALVRVSARPVGDYFAIRMTFQTDMDDASDERWVPAFIVDHIPTGYKLYDGDGIEPASQDQCDAFVRSMLSTPIDWSQADPDFYPGKGSDIAEFVKRAKRAARALESITWDA